LTEHELIQGCIHKKRECEKMLFDRYAGKMMSVCLRYASQEAEAQDILQEGFIKVFSHIHKFRFDGSFEGWMRRVFAHVAIRQMSRKKVVFTELELSENREESVDPAVLSKISEDEIHRMICKMPDGYRTVFNLSVIEGYSHEEIGEMLNIQPATSRGQLFKARKYLQFIIIKKFNTLISIIL
jgi:RNA polymerase sigma-70 factor (ECF subfamily)